MTEKKPCTYCNGTGKVDEFNSSGVMLGIAIYGAAIPFGGGYTVKRDCAYCHGTGKDS